MQLKKLSLEINNVFFQTVALENIIKYGKITSAGIKYAGTKKIVCRLGE